MSAGGARSDRGRGAPSDGTHGGGTHGGGARARRPSRRRSRVVLALLLGGALLVGTEIVLRALGVVSVSSGAATPAQAEFYAGRMFEALDGPPGYGNRPLARCVAGGIPYEHDARGRRIASGGAPRDAAGDDAPEGPRDVSAAAGADARPVLAFLGDSTTYGWGVAAEDALPEAVARALTSPVRALNLGVNGFGTQQQAALYERERGHLGRDVAAVVLVFYPNDTVLHDFRWDDASAALYVDALPVPDGWKPVLWRSVLYRGLVSLHTERLRAAGRLAAGTPAGIDASLAGLARLRAAVHADGRVLVVTHLPAMLTLDPYPFDDVVSRVADACRAAEIPFVDLLPAFLAHREAEIGAYERERGVSLDASHRVHYLSRFWVDDQGRDQHLNAEANRVAGTALAAALDALLGE